MKKDKIKIIMSAVDCATSGQFNVKQLNLIAKDFLERLENYHNSTILPIKTKKIKWEYNKTRQRWITCVEKVRLVIYKMVDMELEYRLSLLPDEKENIENGYMNYISDFRKLESAKAVAQLIIYG